VAFNSLLQNQFRQKLKRYHATQRTPEGSSSTTRPVAASPAFIESIL
jgi:hypothetical protein